MSTHQQPHGPHAFQLERVALFSDAVFAIAITLLVIEIKIPQLPSSNPEFTHAFWEALSDMFPEFLGFFISFTVIGSYWRVHHAMFAYAIDYDRKLLRLNTTFLLTIVILPFTTAFMSRYILSQPFMLYCINVMAAGLLQIRLWRHITNSSHHLHGPIPKGIKAYRTAVPLATVSCFLLAIFIQDLPGWHGNWGGLIARIFLGSIFIVRGFVFRYYKKKYQLNQRD